MVNHCNRKKGPAQKMDRRLPTLAAFIDFRKAFDCVQHPVLLDKLVELGLDSTVTDWFKSYLCNHRQRVLANNTFSPWQSITQGVPQGSVLGPLFYILYANDIVEKVNSCKIALYADDTVLYIASPNFNTAIDKLQADMNSLSNWCKDNGIQMNVDKTNIMVFGGQRIIEMLPGFEIEVDGTPIKKVSNYRYLGVTLDNHLNYNKHVQRTIGRVTLKLKQLRRMRSFLDTRAATLVYKNMILPILEYGDIFMVGTSAENRRRLQVLQNKGLCCALNTDTDTSIKELHTKANLLQLRHSRGIHLLTHMYDQAKHVRNLKVRKEGGVKTRSQNKRLLKMKKPSTERFKKSPTYRGPKRWNALSGDMHHIASRTQFNTKVKFHYDKGLKLDGDE